MKTNPWIILLAGLALGAFALAQDTIPNPIQKTGAGSDLVPPPLAWLSFDNTLNDQTSLVVHHDGTLNNVSGQAVMTNNVATATAGTASLFLPGDGSYVELANPTDFNVNRGQAFTVSAWIKTSANGVIFSKSTAYWTTGGSGTHTAALFVSSAGKLVYDVFFQGAVTSAASVNSGQWTHDQCQPVAGHRRGGQWRWHQ